MDGLLLLFFMAHSHPWCFVVCITNKIFNAKEVYGRKELKTFINKKGTWKACDGTWRRRARKQKLSLKKKMIYATTETFHIFETFQTFLDGKLTWKSFRQSKLSSMENFPFVFEVGLEIISCLPCLIKCIQKLFIIKKIKKISGKWKSALRCSFSQLKSCEHLSSLTFIPNL